MWKGMKSMRDTNHLFFYGNVYHPSKVFLTVPAGEIFQIAELSMVKGSEIPEHVQICDEITYMVSGKAMVYSGDTCFEMSAGQVHFITKGMYHKIIAEADSTPHFLCFGYQVNPEYAELNDYIASVRKSSHFYTNDDGSIKPHMQLLMNEYYNYDSDSDVMLHHYFCQMMRLLTRLAKGAKRSVPGKKNSASVNSVVYRVVKYIDKEYRNIESVKQIAEKLSYSEYYLSHVFKEKMGVTVKEYLMQRKILAATELLKNTSMGVEEIAEHLHFASSHTFRQAFKRYMGMNASEYRNKVNM
jgi:AraC-like DNA-binding protein/quercetin dioxygenase-like cupin family protein